MGASVAETEKTPCLSCGRVLVVDDDPNILEVLTKALEQEGHFVRGAQDPAEALALAKKHRFHVCLLDFCLPGKSGVSLLPDLKAACPGLAVAMISGYGDAPNGLAAGKQGALEWLKKPLSLEKVSATVRQALASAWQAREAEAIQAVRARFAMDDLTRLSDPVRHMVLAAEAGYHRPDLEVSDLIPANLKSVWHASGLFKKSFGVAPWTYVTCLRVELGQRLLADGEPAKTLPRKVGFSTYRGFAKAWRRTQERNSSGMKRL